MTMTKYDLLVRPILSEKSHIVTRENCYVFEVAENADKPHIKDAIQSVFNVKVKKVNISNGGGVRKAYVSLMSGDKIDYNF